MPQNDAPARLQIPARLLTQNSPQTPVIIEIAKNRDRATMRKNIDAARLHLTLRLFTAVLDGSSVALISPLVENRLLLRRTSLSGSRLVRLRWTSLRKCSRSAREESHHRNMILAKV